ncbi:putative endo-1,4-beta-xylanase [Aspergillus tetrazonus]
MGFFQIIAAVSALFAICYAAPAATDSALKPRATNPYFNTVAQAAGKLWFGSAIDTSNAEFSDTLYMSIFNDSRIFGQTTPGNTMKWSYTEPSKGVFAFDQGDVTIALADATGKRVRCHTLVWGSQLPSWVSSGSWTYDTLLAAMKNHIQTEITHFGSSCYSWDVVNEAINYDGTYTDNIFLQVIGENYVPLAFKYAYEAVQATGADIKLFYNDYQIERPGTKASTVINKVLRGVQAWNPLWIDGIGMESHHTTSYYPSVAEVTSVMQSYANLGLEIHITELDVACVTAPCTTAELTAQAQAYYNTVLACMNTAACKGITIWDFNDKYSWIQPATNGGAGEACLFYSNYVPKPAHSAVSDALQGYSCSVC